MVAGTANHTSYIPVVAMPLLAVQVVTSSSSGTKDLCSKACCLRKAHAQTSAEQLMYIYNYNYYIIYNISSTIIYWCPADVLVPRWSSLSPCTPSTSSSSSHLQHPCWTGTVCVLHGGRGTNVWVLPSTGLIFYKAKQAVCSTAWMI